MGIEAFRLWEHPLGNLRLNFRARKMMHEHLVALNPTTPSLPKTQTQQPKTPNLNARGPRTLNTQALNSRPNYYGVLKGERS